jgi:hypothetical protein
MHAVEIDFSARWLGEADRVRRRGNARFGGEQLGDPLRRPGGERNLAPHLAELA